MNIRTLKPNEIDVRVGSINEKGATLLLYKDARVDMNILDESGVKWKRSHELINGNLFCTISVWDEDIKEWVSRQDVGVESNTEKEKGQASDAFKRAAFNFGIGRELYTAPFTWVASDKYNGFVNGKTPQGKDRYATYDKFSVVNIAYNELKEITGLVIKNNNTGKEVFVFGYNSRSNEQPKEVRNRQEESKAGSEPMGESTSDVLVRAKKTINEELIKHDYTRSDQKTAFITMVLEKPTIDNLDDAEEVMLALENEQ